MDKIMRPTKPIAIVGIGCRFPGANTPEELWSLLEEERSTWGPLPSDRWNEEAFLHPDPDCVGTYNHRGGYFLKQDLSAFDGTFFGLSADECAAMDPQQRLMLEVAYEAIENAGIRLNALEGSQTSVHVATYSADYNLMQQKDPSDLPKYYTTGIGTALAANGISYHFNLQGPSLAVDTGCSGSLVAVHLACQSLLVGECDTALAGGVNLMLSPDQMIGGSRMRCVDCELCCGTGEIRCWNEHGKCFAFDDRGNGYGRGEGAAMVVLKRLDDALKDGDLIRAVISGSGINQDGKTNGIMVPSSKAQSALIQSVYRRAGLDPAETPFVEAHGTGTAVGDPIEVAAIRAAFRNEPNGNSLYVGSLKPTIGHLEPTSGIAGLIKGIMILEHNKIPAMIGIKNFKQGLRLNESGIEIPQSLMEWPAGRTPRVSVNNFGYGGTNAHVILDRVDRFRPNHARHAFKDTPMQSSSDEEVEGLEEEDEIGSHNRQRPSKRGTGSPSVSAEEQYVFTLSAKTPKAVNYAAQRLRDWICGQQSSSNSTLHDVAFTLSSRRSPMVHQSAFRASSVEELKAQMSGTMECRKSPVKPRLMMVFTGQGAQWPRMGLELMTTIEHCRESLQNSGKIFLALVPRGTC